MSVSVVRVQAQTPNEKAWRIVQDGAADKSSEKRTQVMNALALLTNDAKARQMAELGLANEKAEDRAAAALTLGQQGSAKSIPKLKNALKETHILLE